MKFIPFFFLIIILSSCLGSLSPNHKLTDWERLNLNGKVKKIVGYDWIAEGDFGTFGKTETDSAEIRYIAHFNEKGYLIEEFDYANFEYRIYTHKDSIERQEMEVYELGFELMREKGDLIKTHWYKYNDGGQLMKEIIKSPTATDSIVLEYEYDSKGNRILDYSPLFGQVLKFEYNDKGQAVKYWAYKNKSAYDKNNYSTEGYRKYDEAGNMIEEGWSGFKRIFRYDKDRNMLERTSVHSKTDIRERLFLYQSDDQNNWIWRTKKNNRYLSERVITYF